VSRRASLLLVAAVGLAATALPLSPSAGDASSPRATHRIVPAVGGQQVVVEPVPELPPGLAATRDRSPRRIQSTVATFELESRPGAARTIFIDFDGHAMGSTSWASAGWPGGTYPRFGLDGSSTFNADEQAIIRQVWARVAEDFAPFDVNVTTRAPSAAALERSTATDPTYGVRALVVGDSDPTVNQAIETRCGGGCAGIAYIDTFAQLASRGEKPALIFSGPLRDAMGDGDLLAWQLAETVTHEVGHTLGLYHDEGPSGRGGEYYVGSKPWSPIMGGGIYGLTQWSKGEYVGYSSEQANPDDLALIAAPDKLPLRADDHADDTATATVLGRFAQTSRVGVITSESDEDVFRLDRACAGPAQVLATPAAIGPNLDIELELVGPSGQVVETVNPADPDADPLSDPRFVDMAVKNLAASLTIPQVQGTHYLVVRGGGQGNPLTGGWSRYGSLGAYTLSVSTCADEAGSEPDPDPPAPPPPPPPVARAPLAPTGLTIAPGAKGKPVTVVVRWRASTTRGTPVTAYALTARKHVKKRVTKTVTRVVPASARSLNWKVGKGRWSVRVQARSAVGASPATAWSRQVAAR